jgi:hypothetical protein
LHVLIPHAWLNGTVGPSSHLAWLHVAPAAAQMPQLALQQTSPMLHVLLPHPALFGNEAKPQLCLVQVWPGGVQIPHVALQHTSPGAHVAAPHTTGGAGCALGAGCDAVGGGADGVKDDGAEASGVGASAA